MSDSSELVRAWKDKSEHLKACRQLLQADEPLAEIIAFHAQQAVEKALKGFLLSRKCFDFPKTHALGRLLDLAESLSQSCQTSMRLLNSPHTLLKCVTLNHWIGVAILMRVNTWS